MQAFEDEHEVQDEPEITRFSPVWKNFVFTVNNYAVLKNGKPRGVIATEWLKENCSYWCYGFEVGSKSGIPHLQGYAELRRPTKANTVGKGMSCYCARRRGSAEQAIAYTKKDAGKDWFEEGCRKQQGARADLDRMRTIALEDGMRGVTEIGNAQQIKVAETFLKYHEPARDWETEVWWIWGDPGVGKSRLARSIAGEADVYCKSANPKWWDGYDGHENIIWDDFRRPESQEHWLVALNVLDSYTECKVEVKNSMRQMLARRIIITSIYPPEMCVWGGEPPYQLLRRLSHVVALGKKVTEVTEVVGVIMETPRKMPEGVSDLVAWGLQPPLG